MTIDLCKNKDNRITNIQVKNEFGNFEALNDTRVYKVATIAYLADGGSKFTMIKGKIITEHL